MSFQIHWGFGAPFLQPEGCRFGLQEKHSLETNETPGRLRSGGEERDRLRIHARGHTTGDRGHTTGDPRLFRCLSGAGPDIRTGRARDFM